MDFYDLTDEEKENFSTDYFLNTSVEKIIEKLKENCTINELKIIIQSLIEQF